MCTRTLLGFDIFTIWLLMLLSFYGKHLCKHAPAEREHGSMCAMFEHHAVFEHHHHITQLMLAKCTTVAVVASTRARVACWHNNVIICQCAPTAASTHVCEWVIAFFGRACVCVRMVFVKHMRECFVYWRDKRRPPNAMIATMASLIRHMVRGRVPCGQRLCYYDGIYGAHIPRERVRQR